MINRNIKEILKEKKGTAMVEAAIVMPLVILSVIAMIYLLINIYATVSLQSHIHLLLREECGIKSGMVVNEIKDEYIRDRIRNKAESSNIDIKDGGSLLSSWLEAKRDIVYKANMMIKKPPSKTSYGRSFVYNESDIVRFKKIVSID